MLDIHTPIRPAIAQITLMSETDKFGTILFVNDAFIRTSKYARHELVGKPHNVIRHPDMPKALFARLWSTILTGGIFKGIIKNRAADGSHYWVNATIMAILDEEDNIERCIAVRHLIADDRLAEKLYEAQAKALNL